VAMVECNMAASTPFVVAVTGTSGAGNTTLVHGLIEVSATAGITAVSLQFNDFAASSNFSKQTCRPGCRAAVVRMIGAPTRWSKCSVV